MTLWELVSATRQQYVDGYRHLLQQQRPHVQELMAEALMRTEGPQEVPIDFRVLRVDLLWREPATTPGTADASPAGSAAAPPLAQPVEGEPAAASAESAAAATPPAGKMQVAAISPPQAPPLTAPLVTQYPDGQVVVVHSLPWSDCPIIITPAPASASAADAALVGWLRRWRDRQDSPHPDADGLYSAVHSMTPPQLGTGPRGESLLGFAVDFGSAPPEAFTGLVAVLLAAGARLIQIGTPAQPVQPPPAASHLA